MATPPQLASNNSSNNEKMVGILPNANTVVENKQQQENDEEHTEEAMSLEEIDRLLGRSAEESILLNSYFACLSTNQKSLATVM